MNLDLLQNVTSEVNTICDLSLQSEQVTYTLFFEHHSKPFSLFRGQKCITFNPSNQRADPQLQHNPKVMYLLHRLLDEICLLLLLWL